VTFRLLSASPVTNALNYKLRQGWPVFFMTDRGMYWFYGATGNRNPVVLKGF
jgi:hypothetical protein